MTSSSSGASIQRVAREGDRALRGQRAAAVVRTAAPIAAAVAAASGAFAVGVGGPRWIGPLLLVTSALVFLLLLVLARRDRVVPEAVVTELDRAADLGGALESAHWFSVEADTRREGDADRPDAAWIAYHVETAARRAAAVSWATVYARPSARAASLLTVAFAVVAMAIAAWPEAVRATLIVGEGEARASASGGPAIPAALLPQLVEGMRAIKTGRPPSKEELAAIGMALEIAKDDSKWREELDKLFADAGEFADDPAMFDESRDGYELRAQAEQGYGMDPSLEWAYQEAAAKASADRQSPKEGESDPSAAGQSNSGESEQGIQAEAGLGSPSEGAEPADGQGQVATFSSLLFGKQPSGGDGKGAPQAAKSNMSALMAALRREVVNAQRDVEGASGGRGDRRATNSTTARSSAVSGTIDTTYEQARATRPPAVPDARRPLVHDFFVRPAATGSAGSSP